MQIFVSLLLADDCCVPINCRIIDHIHVFIVSTVNFGFNFDVDHVIISPPSTGSSSAGRTDYSLTCSSTLYQPPRLSEAVGVPSPNFQWSFDGSASLPSGVTAMSTVMSSSNSTSETYTSALQFSQLSQSLHTGMYTCRLGPGRLLNNITVTVNGNILYVSL